MKYNFLISIFYLLLLTSCNSNNNVILGEPYSEAPMLPEINSTFSNYSCDDIASSFITLEEPVAYSVSNDPVYGNEPRVITKKENIDKDDVTIFHDTPKFGLVTFESNTFIDGARYVWHIFNGKGELLAEIIRYQPMVEINFKQEGRYEVEVNITYKEKTYKGNGFITIPKEYHSNSNILEDNFLIAMSDNNTFIYDNNSKLLYTYGLNEKGSLCLKERNKFNMPTVNSNISNEILKNLTSISSARAHTFLVSDNKSVYACGDNSKWQLGLSSTSSIVDKPTKVEQLEKVDGKDVEYISIAAGGDLSVAALNYKSSSSSMNADKVRLYRWGFDANEPKGYTSGLVNLSEKGDGVAIEKPVVAAGKNFAILWVDNTRRLYSFGVNNKWQLGRISGVGLDTLKGSNIEAKDPANPANSAKNSTDMKLGLVYSLLGAIDIDNRDNLYSKFGDFKLDKLLTISCGEASTYITYSDNIKRKGFQDSLDSRRSATWGHNAPNPFDTSREPILYGSLGVIVVSSDSYAPQEYIKKPVPLIDPADFSSPTQKDNDNHYILLTVSQKEANYFAAGRYHFLTVDYFQPKKIGYIYLEGINDKGQLGHYSSVILRKYLPLYDGDNVQTYYLNNKILFSPCRNFINNYTLSSNLFDIPYRNVWAGGDRSIALADDGNLYTWGDNSNEILGLGENYAGYKFIRNPTKLRFVLSKN